MNYITELTIDLLGKRIKCRIDGVRITEGKVGMTNDASFIICQDVKDNVDTENKQDYKHAWNCGDGTSEALQAAGVSVIDVLPPLHNFKEGDYVLITSEIVPELKGKITYITGIVSDDVFGLHIDGGRNEWKAMQDFVDAGVQSIEIKDMKKGPIYVCIYEPGNDLIFKSKKDGEAYAEKYILIKGTTYGSNVSLDGQKRKHRTATPDEQLHLTACIKANDRVDPPTPENIDIANTKIWVDEDVELNKEVRKQLIKRGAEIEEDPSFSSAAAFYVDRDDMRIRISSQEEGRKCFTDNEKIEILPRHLGIGVKDPKDVAAGISSDALIEMILNNA